MSILKQGFTVAGDRVDSFSIKLLEKLAEVNTELGELNRGSQSDFFEYLKDLATDLGLKDTAQTFETMRATLSNLPDIDWEGSSNYKAADLNRAFKGLWDNKSDPRVPVSQMNYVLNALSQKLLPNGQVGWLHTCPYGTAPKINQP